MTAIILSALALVAAIAALVVAVHTRRQLGAMTQDFHAILDALDGGDASPAAPEPVETRRDYSVLDDVGKAIAARGRSSSP